MTGEAFDLCEMPVPRNYIQSTGDECLGLAKEKRKTGKCISENFYSHLFPDSVFVNRRQGEGRAFLNLQRMSAWRRVPEALCRTCAFLAQKKKMYQMYIKMKR